MNNSPSEYQTTKSLILSCFCYSDVWYSDLYCILILVSKLEFWSLIYQVFKDKLFQMLDGRTDSSKVVSLQISNASHNMEGCARVGLGAVY